MRAAYRDRGETSPRVRDPRALPPAVALLSEEEAGKVITVSAGAVRLEAAFRGRPGEKLPAPALPEPRPNVCYGPARLEEDGETLRVSCEARATRAQDLAAAVNEALRALSAHAALAGAVMEARVVRLAEPLVPDARLVGGLARVLSTSGLRVSFGPSAAPAPGGAGVCVGAFGREREIENLLREHPRWHPIYL